MFNKKTTLQVAGMLADTAIDENLKKRYGTSVNEYMTREHTKEMQIQINNLRNEFARMGKDKTSPISLDELYDFLQKINVNIFFIINSIYIY